MTTETFTVKHKYAPSVLAVYSSSCNLIWVVRTLYGWEPELSARFSVLWSNCFSAAVRISPVHPASNSNVFHYNQCALCLLVSRAPSLPIAPYALQELDKLKSLFLDVQDQHPRVTSYLVRHSMTSSLSSLPTNVPPHRPF